jgi:ketosteroid isomerase-like protein
MYTDSAVWLDSSGNVFMGKPAILASMEEDMAGRPMLEVTQLDSKIIGDHAVGFGKYSTTIGAGTDSAMTVTGHYMTHSVRDGSGWKIAVGITNFDAPPTFELPPVDTAMVAPPDEGTLTDLLAQWKQAYDTNQPAAVAQLYAPEARVAISDAPLATGPAAIEATLRQRLATGSPKITIHDVYTLDLGDGYALDAGWWESTATGAPNRSGAYMLLARRQQDGTYRIEWHVSNGRPNTQ